MIVGPWRISQVVLFKLFARTAERREGSSKKSGKTGIPRR